MRRWIARAWTVVGVVAIAWIAYPNVRARVLDVEETPARRGERLAHDLGCFACHGAGGGGGVRNPTSDEGRTWRDLAEEVPAFTEQTQMMYVKTTDDLREYILDGAPRRRREDAAYMAKIEAGGIRMPAYRGHVSAAELEDLVAYLRASSGQVFPDDPVVRRGGDLFLEFSCAACHGSLGTGGMPNPGSFKGYVPGFWGADFDELVRDDAELRRWITDGRIARIADHPIGGWFFRRQRVSMPAYGRFLSLDELDALVAYVRWLRSDAWRDALR